MSEIGGVVIAGITSPYSLIKYSFTMLSLNFLLNGPAYDTNAEAINTSPTYNSNSDYNLTIESAQRTFSDFNAATKRVAKSNLLAHLAAKASASFLVLRAASNSAYNLAYFSFKILTFSITDANFSLASSNIAIDSFNALRLGSTS